MQIIRLGALGCWLGVLEQKEELLLEGYKWVEIEHVRDSEAMEEPLT